MPAVCCSAIAVLGDSKVVTEIVGIEGKSDKVSIFDDKTEDSSDEVGTQLWMYFCNNKPVKGGLSMFV